MRTTRITRCWPTPWRTWARTRRRLIAGCRGTSRAATSSIASWAAPEGRPTMDEQTWLTSQDLRAMLEHLRDTANVNRTRAGRRKLRLVACACARVVWCWLSEPAREVVLGAELVADGRSTEQEHEARVEALRQHLTTVRTLSRADGMVYAAM